VLLDDRMMQPSEAVEAPAYAAVGATPHARWRARVCPAAILTADLLAFLLAACLAFVISSAASPPPYMRALENLTTMGAG